ncbi:phage tail tape measure protein [Clostridium sp. AF15-17LB]|nr:phage tail tape measure protein [Clostridium sp. AF15-17LB]
MEDYGVAKGYIDLDISKLERAVQTGVRELDNLDRKSALVESEFNRMQSAGNKVGGVFQQAAQKSKVLAEQIAQSKSKCELYNKEIGNLNTIIGIAKEKQGELTNKIKDATSKYEQSKAKVEAAAEAHGKESKEYENAVRKSLELENGLNQLESQYDALGIEVEQSEQSIVEFKTKLNNTEASINVMNRQLAESQNKVLLYGQAWQGAGEKLQAVGDKINGLGNKLSIGITAPAVAAGTASVKLASDATTSFAKVSTIADSTVLSYSAMEKGVTAASDKTGVAITDFNEALYQSLSAGVDSGKAIGFTTDMVKLAKGGFTDTAKAVDVVTSVLNAYGLSADEATAVSDKLILTQNVGKTTVDELASSLGRVIPTAKAVNVDMDNVSTAMAILTKRGIQTAEATTYYNSMLNELGKSGTTADKALRDVAGKGFKDLVAEGKPVTEILQMVDDYAKQNGLSLSDMFGSMEAGKAALSIMSDGGKEYNEVLKEMQNSAGTTQQAFEKMDSTPAAKMQKELNKLKNTGIKTGQQLLPLVTDAMEAVGNLAEGFSKLPKKQQGAIVKTVGFAAALGPVLKVTGGVTKGVGGLTKGFGKLIEAAGKTASLNTVASTAAGVGDAATAAAKGTSLMSGVISAVTSPVGIAVTSVAALTAGVIALDAVIGDSIEETYRLTDSQRKALDSMNEHTKALEEQKSAREKSVQSIEREYDGYDSLVTELQSITDENGKVKTGYEERAKVITGQLSEALGIEISLMDGVIGKYEETINSIKELIVQKKAESIASAMQDDMSKAYENSEKAVQDYKKASKDLEEQQKKVIEAEEAYRRGGPAQYKAYQQAVKDQKSLEKALSKSKTAMQDLSTEVNNYDSLIDAMASGDTAKIEEAMNALVTSYRSYTAEALSASQETREQMYGQANSYIENMKLVQDGTVQVADSVYQEMARSAINSINEFNKLPGGVSQGIQDIGPEASAAMITTLAQANLDGILDAEAKNDLQSFISGFSTLGPETQEAWAQAWYGALEGLEGFGELADPAKDGVDAFLESLRAALEVHSPSAAVQRIFAQVWPGASAGLEEGKEGVTEKGKSTVASLLGGIIGEVGNSSGKFRQSMTDTGIAGNDAMGAGLLSKKLLPPNVNNINAASKSIGIGGNTNMGLGLIYRKLTGPKLYDINSSASSIGIAGNTNMGIGLRANMLDGPSIKDLEAASKATKARKDMQSYFDDNPLSVVVNVVKKIGGAIGEALGFADGGIATSPAIFGEAGPEMAIPLSASKRTRALSLYKQTGELLGISKEESALRTMAMNDLYNAKNVTKSMGKNEIFIKMQEPDYDLLTEKLADVLRKVPIKPQVIVQMEDGDVYISDEKAGRKLAPVVSRIISQNT